MKKEYIKFELRSIDAWRDTEGVWMWNESYRLEDGIVFEESELTTRKILKALRAWKYLSQKSKGMVTVCYDGDIYEIQDKNTHEPLLALIPSA